MISWSFCGKNEVDLLSGILSKFGTFYLEFPNATGSIFYRQAQEYPPSTWFKGGLFVHLFGGSFMISYGQYEKGRLYHAEL